MGVLRACFRADDIGSSRSANSALRQYADCGIARNISLMVPVPYFAEAASYLKTRTDLCVGLHVTLNCEWTNVQWSPTLPAAQVPSLVNASGHFFPETKDLHNKPMQLEHAVVEVSNQLRLAREAGLDIRYLDEHMGVGWVAGLSGPLEDLCRREGVICLLKQHFRSFHANALSGPALAAHVLATTPDDNPVPYLMVLHPACDDEEFEQYCLSQSRPGEVSRQRDLDRQAYCEGSLAQAVKSGAVVSLRFDELV